MPVMYLNNTVINYKHYRLLTGRFFFFSVSFIFVNCKLNKMIASHTTAATSCATLPVYSNNIFRRLYCAQLKTIFSCSIDKNK